jgi:hypothetical protein
MNYTFRPIDQWPRDKTKRPKPTPFSSTYTQTLKLLGKELAALDAKQIIFQIDVPESQIRGDGLPYARARPDFQGVIVAFESKHGPLKYMTDVFNDWHENLRAIALGLEALRRVDRYGITSKGEQYTGWKQLPAVSEAKEDAAGLIASLGGEDKDEVMNNADTARRAFRRAAKKVHEDKKGGSREQFIRLMEARKLLGI